MPRLIALLLVVLAGIGLASLVARQSRPSGDKGPRNTYRPRATSHPEGSASGDEIFMMSRRDAAGLRDPLTGSVINTGARVWHCARCQSLYNDSSKDALAADNQGACVQCRSRQLSPVSFTDP